MNASQYITLKMGNKYIFKESLQALKSSSNSNYVNNNQRNNYYSPNNYNNNNNRRMNPKRSYQGMDVIPKFIANQNMQEINKELLDRLSNKKVIFNKMMKSYFSEGTEFFTNSIREIENQVMNERFSVESNNNRDYEGFKELISFINSNRTNPKLTSFQNMSLDEYKVMNNEAKNQIMEGINQNKPLFQQKLKLKYKNENINNNNFDKNPYIGNNQRPRALTSNFNKNMNYKGKQKNNITAEQIDLFKIFIGNKNLSNNEALNFFDSGNPKVMLAADKYFRKKYNTDCLTLQYVYPYQPKLGTKIHKFRFYSEISELFMASHKDYLSLNNPRLYMENGKEIKDDKKIKCIGALGIQNNTKIKVLI